MPPETSLVAALASPLESRSDRRSFVEGVTVGVTNPKTVVFLAAIGRGCSNGLCGLLVSANAFWGGEALAELVARAQASRLPSPRLD